MFHLINKKTWCKILLQIPDVTNYKGIPYYPMMLGEIELLPVDDILYFSPNICKTKPANIPFPLDRIEFNVKENKHSTVWLCSEVLGLQHYAKEEG